MTPKAFERKVAKRGGAKRWRNKAIPGHPNKYLKCAVVGKSGKRGGKTVCYKKTKKAKKK